MCGIEGVLIVDRNHLIHIHLLQDGSHHLLLQIPVLALHTDDNVIGPVLSRSLVREGHNVYFVEHRVPVSDLADEMVLFHLDGDLGDVEGGALDLREQRPHHGGQHARAVRHDEAVVLLDDRPSLQNFVPVPLLTLLDRGDLADNLRAERKVCELEVKVSDLLLGDALDDQLQQLRVPLHPRPERFRHSRQRDILMPSAGSSGDEEVLVYWTHPPYHERDDVDVILDLHHLLQRNAHVLQGSSKDVRVVLFDQTGHNLISDDQHRCCVSCCVGPLAVGPNRALGESLDPRAVLLALVHEAPSWKVLVESGGVDFLLVLLAVDVCPQLLVVADLELLHLRVPLPEGGCRVEVLVHLGQQRLHVLSEERRISDRVNDGPDGGVTFIVQAAVRELQRLDEVPDISVGPLKDGAEPHQ
mmetsp:Transcript_46957/g.147144  ORF Transcript_46957/g.147144 Transcript_46957/m.147144 type:complete len:414 (-) Transcript_46957:1001-2242(-)